MNERGPDFDELVGSDLPPAERDRLLRVHGLLLEADPPASSAAAPTGPPAVTHEDGEPARVVSLRRRRGLLALGLAAAVAAAAFGLGALVGNRAAGPTASYTVSMRGTPAAMEASASLAVYPLDKGGNWPLEMTVTGLEPSRTGVPYELWLTKGGKLAELCGSFRTAADGSASVPMNAPYTFSDYDGWVVVRHGEQTPLLTT